MDDWIIPDWPAPSNVKAFFTTRTGGVSKNHTGTYASLNLGMHVNDDAAHVAYNRSLVRHHLPTEPRWLKQVHGTVPVWVDCETSTTSEGDAALSHTPGVVCAVMVADCLPILFCDAAGSTVGLVHAGWRGLAGGIVEQTIAAMQIDPCKLIAWLGPAIGPDHFEVGTDVYETFVRHDEQSASAFTPKNDQKEKKWLADIFLLARQRLMNAGICNIFGGGVCTYSNPARFFSYRRDGETGRMAAFIWRD